MVVDAAYDHAYVREYILISKHKSYLRQYSSLMSRKVMFGTTLAASLFFMIVGVIFWGGFNTAMEATNTLDFCISCHEMEENVYKEYQKTIHYTNNSGVRATCSDCHVPRPWIHKVVRKIQASNELLHKVLGSIDTPEKFEAKRLELSQHVWDGMRETDSRECRNCHAFDSMSLSSQKKSSQTAHARAVDKGQTCIDCHMGIAHKIAKDFDKDLVLHDKFKKEGRPCADCHKGMQDKGLGW